MLAGGMNHWKALKTKQMSIIGRQFPSSDHHTVSYGNREQMH